jgi:hypothetical protein
MAQLAPDGVLHVANFVAATIDSVLDNKVNLMNEYIC